MFTRQFAFLLLNDLSSDVNLSDTVGVSGWLFEFLTTLILMCMAPITVSNLLGLPTNSFARKPEWQSNDTSNRLCDY